MDNARQIIRWAIPGWVIFVFFFIFVAIRYGVVALFTDPSLLKVTYSLKAFSGLIDPTLGIVLGAAGVPIGYIIYQIYFALTWRALSLFGKIVLMPEDRGLEILEGIDLSRALGRSNLPLPDDLKVISTPKPNYWPKDKSKLRVILPNVKYVRNCELPNDWDIHKLRNAMTHNWALVLLVWYKGIANRSDSINRQVTYMFDIYHSQGAVIWALMSAYFLYHVYDVLANYPSIWQSNSNWWLIIPLALILNFLIFVFLYRVIVSVRRTTVSQIVFMMRNLILLDAMDTAKG